jgi:hypothetical protein
MRPPTPRDLRNAVLLAVLVTTIVLLALFDPSCRPAATSGRWTPPPATPAP